jgi:hypothetical protein
VSDREKNRNSTSRKRFDHRARYIGSALPGAGNTPAAIRVLQPD